MSETPTIHWDGKSGKSYKYWIHPIGTSFKEETGNYIFAYESKTNHWRPVYIGQTENLSQRLENHEKEDCAKRNGATHIHSHINSYKTQRLYEEKDLILKWQPYCNDQLVD
jgi:hypothetical protein